MSILDSMIYNERRCGVRFSPARKMIFVPKNRRYSVFNKDTNRPPQNDDYFSS